MKTKRYPMAALVCGLAAGYAASAPAALVTAGDGLINDTTLDITWVQDANLFQTMAMAQQDGGLVDTIIGVMPTFNDLSWGERTLDAEMDFNPTSGEMSWWGAQAWVGYLNSISYKGYADWRLPRVTDIVLPADNFLPGCDFGFSATDCGWNVDPGSSELAHLYYQELGNLSPYTVDGDDAGVTGGVTTPGPFTNLADVTYWTGTEDASFTFAAWGFQTSDGGQFVYDKDLRYLGWVVRDNQTVVPAAPVPLPAAFWLLFSGLGGLGWFGFRGRKTASWHRAAI